MNANNFVILLIFLLSTYSCYCGKNSINDKEDTLTLLGQGERKRNNFSPLNSFNGLKMPWKNKGVGIPYQLNVIENSTKSSESNISDDGFTENSSSIESRRRELLKKISNGEKFVFFINMLF